jgi:hypothetical protein
MNFALESCRFVFEKGARWTDTRVRASRRRFCYTYQSVSSGKTHQAAPDVTHLYTMFGEWLSLVEHLVRDQGVGGSNPLSPTIIINSLRRILTTRNSLWFPNGFPLFDHSPVEKSLAEQGFSSSVLHPVQQIRLRTTRVTASTRSSPPCLRIDIKLDVPAPRDRCYYLVELSVVNTLVCDYAIAEDILPPKCSWLKACRKVRRGNACEKGICSFNLVASCRSSN